MLTRDGQRRTVRPNCSLVADNSEAILIATLEGAGIALLPDWLVGPAVRARKLIQVLPGWNGKGDGGVYALLPPGRLIPTKTRVFVDSMAEAIRAGWARLRERLPPTFRTMPAIIHRAGAIALARPAVIATRRGLMLRIVAI
jgi:LysR substrate binding domain